MSDNLLYGQDRLFMVNSDWLDGWNFTSFKISRSLEEQEQLDISTMGQNSGQDWVWQCGEYMMSYKVGTDAGCNTISNGQKAGCVRLWHY